MLVVDDTRIDLIRMRLAVERLVMPFHSFLDLQKYVHFATSVASITAVWDLEPGRRRRSARSTSVERCET